MVTCSMLQRLEATILSQWEQWELHGPRPKGLQWVLLAQHHTQKSIIKFSHPASGVPVVVAKMANVPATSHQVQTEFNNLQNLWKDLGDQRHRSLSLPRPLTSMDVGWRPVFLETALDGMSVYSILCGAPRFTKPRQRYLVLRACFEWLVAFHQSLSTSSTLRQHGDFATSNIFLMDGKDIGVIDWEHFGAYPPCFDLFAFIWSSAYTIERRGAGDRTFDRSMSAFERSFFTPSWLGSLAASFLDEYCHTLHLDRSRATEWYEQSLTLKQGQLEKMYGARNIHARAYGALLERGRQQPPLFLKG